MTDIKDPLSYTDEELNSLSDDELKLIIAEAQSLESRYNVLQNMLKVLINGLYGALANRWFPLFNEKLAQAITGNGRYYIQQTGKMVNDFLKSKIPDNEYLIYSDTDSNYYTIGPFVQKFLENNPESTKNDIVNFCDSFCESIIQPIIQSSIDTLATNFNAFDKGVINMEREIISDQIVFIAKKKYMARVLDNEGHRYPENSPKYKVMGLDVIKGGTAVWSKKHLNEAIPHILDKTENELRDWLMSIKQSYIQQKPSDIAIIAGVTNLEYNLGEKGIPIGARSALVHNKYVKDNNLDDVYTLIDAGERTKRIYLKEPNKFNSNIIAYLHDGFAKEIADCIDWDVMFEKGFLNLLENMIKGLNYNIQKETASLDDW